MVDKKEKIGVLFVCMGNICRSPTAEGIFRKMVGDAGLEDRIHTDSAGTHAYHNGEGPDRRGMAAAENRGYSLQGIQARRVSVDDFEEFDHILAMDKLNLVTLEESCPPEYLGKLQLFLRFAGSSSEHEVPDPYYGGSAGFERVLDLVEDASRAMLEKLRREL